MKNQIQQTDIADFKFPDNKNLFDIKIEQNILGTIIYDSEHLNIAMELLRSEMFFDSAHQTIFSIITDYYEEDKPININLIKHKLENHKIFNSTGGLDKLFSLCSDKTNVENFKKYCDIINKKYFTRKTLQNLSILKNHILDGTLNLRSILDLEQSFLDTISSARIKNNFTFVHEELNSILNKLENQDIFSIDSILSGYNKLDCITKGFKKGELIVLAGRPGIGKTAFALGLIGKSSKLYNSKIAYFSLEMSSNSLIQRLMLNNSKVNFSNVKLEKMPNAELNKMVSNAVSLYKNIIAIDDSSFTIREIRANCHKLISKNNLDFIIIDYLQLINQTDNDISREKHISLIMKSLKKLAKDLNIPVICISQIRRPLTGRLDTRPNLTDFESISIEQQADLILLINQEKLSVSFVKDKEFKSQIIIAKNNRGPLGIIDFKYLSEYARFEETIYCEEKEDEF